MSTPDLKFFEPRSMQETVHGWILYTTRRD